MPIHDISFEDGIYFARESGEISLADAELWAKYAVLYASHSQTPIVALIDARDVTFITVEARRVFVRASHIPNLRGACVATKSVRNAQTSRIIGKMSLDDHTFVFETLEEARWYAQRLAHESSADVS
jgi:hypothetical protein